MIVHKGSKIAVVEQLDVAAVMSVSEEPPVVPELSSVSKEKQEMLWQKSEL